MEINNLIRKEELLIVSIIAISLIGSICRSVINMVDQGERIFIKKIIISIIVSSFLSYLLSDFILNGYGHRVFAGVCFIISVMGSEIGSLMNIAKLKLFIRAYLLKDKDALIELLTDEKPNTTNKGNITYTINNTYTGSKVNTKNEFKPPKDK